MRLERFASPPIPTRLDCLFVRVFRTHTLKVVQPSDEICAAERPCTLNVLQVRPSRPALIAFRATMRLEIFARAPIRLVLIAFACKC